MTQKCDICKKVGRGEDYNLISRYQTTRWGNFDTTLCHDCYNKDENIQGSRDLLWRQQRAKEYEERPKTTVKKKTLDELFWMRD